VKFHDTLTGTVLGSHFNNGNLVLTFDGGTTWNEIVIMCTNALFLNETNGWVLNTTGDILFTADVGQSWTLKYNGVDNLNDIAFINDLYGWAVGDNGVILHTDDGGESWQNQSSPVNVDLLKVEFVNENHGWIAGMDGVLLHTVSGGLVSLDEISYMNRPDLLIYPNPASDRLTISVGNYSMDEVRLYSISGQEIVKKKNNENLDLSGIPVGLYIIEVRVKNMIFRQKLVIQ